MGADIRKRLRVDHRYLVTVHPIVKPVAPPRLLSGYDPGPAPTPIFGNVPTQIYDGATFLVRQRRTSHPEDYWNIFQRFKMETNITARRSEQLALSYKVIDNALVSPEDNPYRYHGSDRPLYSRCWPWQATDECSGYLAGMTYRRQGHTEAVPQQKHFEWIHADFPVPMPENPNDLTRHHLQQMISPARQLANLERLDELGVIPPEETQAFEHARQQVTRLQQEDFDGTTGARVQRDGVLSPPLNSGLYHMAFTCPAHYHPWSMYDPVNYLVTKDPFFEGARPIDPPWVACGEGQSTRVNVFAVPQRHIYIYQWWTLYILGTLFWWTYLYRPQSGTFRDALPWYPLPFAFTTIQDTAINDVAVSEYISQSQRYAVSINQDRAMEYATPWSFQILVGRVEGRWSLRYGALDEGELAAIIDITRGTQTTRYYVYRKTTEGKNRGLIDFGPFGSDEVTPFNRAGPSWDFTAGIPYGPL